MATENSIQLVKGGTIGGTNLSTGATVASSGSFVNVSYGGASSLWGQTWTPSDINASNFGSAVSFAGTSTSQYLKGTNYGFSIPPSATINGIQLDVKQQFVGSSGTMEVALLNLTVWYTWNGASQSQMRSGGNISGSGIKTGGSL